MLKNNIITAAFAVAALASVSFAGTEQAIITIPVAPQPAPVACPITGSVATGYNSVYDFRGIIPAIDNHGSWNFSANGAYAVNEATSVVAGLKWTVPTTTVTWLGNPQETFADHRALDLKQELVFDLGAQHKIKDLTVYGGYRMTYGGLAGLGAKARHAHGNRGPNGVVVHGHTPVVQEFATGARYDVAGTGLYTAANISYAFQGLTGWWFDVTAGYNHKITETVSAGISLIANASANYWAKPDRSGDLGMRGGWQSFALRFDVPWQVCEKVVVTPFCSLNWAGSGMRMDADRGSRGGAARQDWPSVKNFGVVSGVNVNYSF